MTTVNDVFELLNKFAPVERKMDFDNVGFLVGNGNSEVKKVLVALDITDEVVQEAIDLGAQLIVSHHPMFFSLKSVNNNDATGRKIVKLISNGISAICMHTNLDAADGGVNDALACTVGLNDMELLVSEGTDSNGVEYCCGRVGVLRRPMEMDKYLELVKNGLKTKGLRYYSSGNPVNKVAVVGGSGGAYLEHAAALGCDTIITADVKYDVFLRAKELGMNIIDGDHFCTENVVVPVIKRVLEFGFADMEISVSEKHNQVVNFF